MGRKEQAAETEVALKEAAKRLFAERGYLNTKITDITTSAGRAAGSFYNHFAGKEELLEALLADLSAAADETVSATDTEHNPDFTDPAAVRWHIRGYWLFYRENAAVMLALRQAAMVNEEFGRKLVRFGATEQADVAGHLDYISRAGLRLPGEPGAALTMMYGVVEQFMQQRMLGGNPALTELSDEAAIETLTRFVYRGLTGRDY
ncbi:TetR/AcrR family transcriptional regulator [Amycolatopsis nigrescens]|uniref:TetR/AcrR family transcriptional regulator n=1 Tax=Amycolatopsis nigrescens TaxID=381445 RepID=UPI0003748F8C|nr:TetR/AcrR family transcriptional regulator [Amycolatopsis nigrescens]